MQQDAEVQYNPMPVWYTLILRTPPPMEPGELSRYMNLATGSTMEQQIGFPAEATVPYPLGTGRPFPGGEAAETWSPPLNSI
jgi:hypothetical protein